MDNSTSKLLDETVRFIERYNTDLTFQKQLNQVLDNPQISLRRVMYRGRPLKLYTDIISKTLYYKYREYQQKIKASPPEAKTLLKICYNAQDLANLAKAKNNLNQFFSPQEQEEINRIEQLPKEQKPKEFKKMLEKQNQLLPPQPQNPTVEEILQQDDATAMLLGEDHMPTIPRSPIIKIGENKDGEEDGEEDIETGGKEEPHIIPSPQINPPKPQIPVKIEESIARFRQFKIPKFQLPIIVKKFIAKYTQPSKVFSFLATPLKLARQALGIGGNTASKMPNNLPEPQIPVKIEESIARFRQFKIPKFQLPIIVKKFIAKYTQPSKVFSFLATPLKLARQALGIGGNLASRGTSAAVRAGGNTASKIGSGVLDAGEKMLKGRAKKATDKAAAKLAATGVKFLFTNPVGWAILGIIIFIFLFIFIIIVQQGVSTGDNNYTAGDISQCKFTRGQENPPSAQYKSPLLLSYFQEASQKSGVPAVVLAAITRVESASSAYKTDADLATMKCPESGDGALGLMQIIPQFSPRTDAFCRDCVALGASYLGKTVDQLTRDDYCNPRTSIFLGAGFILKKIGDGTKWDPAWTNDRDIINKLASGFYGCLLYGDRTPCSGSFNYGDDLWNSIQSCKINNLITNSALVSCPLSKNGSGTFNITCGTFKTPNSGGCGHGLFPIYPTCVSPPYAVCPYSNQLKAAIDVRPSGNNGSNDPVYLPFINGISVNWTLNSGPITLNGGSWGVKLEYIATAPDGKQYRLDLTHLDPNINTGANTSGDQVGVTKAGVDADGGHLHTAVSLNGSWLDAISEAHICSPQ